MEDQPSTPDSDATLRGFTMPPCTPLRKTRLYELGSQERSAASPSDLNPRASPFESASQTPTNAQFPDPFTQEQKVEQRFRPSSCNEKAPDAQDCLLSSTSEMPSSPEVKRFEPHGNAREENDDDSPDTATWYGGVPLRPNQLPTLTTYGLLDKHSDPSPASRGNDASSSDDDTGGVPFTPSSSDAKSTLIGSTTHGFNKIEDNKGASSQARQGQGSNLEGERGDYRVASQTKSFNDLAKQRGIREWDNKTFDNRWELRSDEITNRVSPPKHDLAQSARILSRDGGSSGTKGATSKVSVGSGQQDSLDKSYGYGTSQISRQEPEFSRFEFPATERPSQSFSIDRTPVSQIPHRSETSFVATPPEATRLQQVIREIESGRIQYTLPILSRVPFERYFNERVFGNADGPAPFEHNEAHVLTKFNNHILTLGELRSEIVREINSLISDLMAPAGKRLIELDDGTGPDVEGTTALRSTAIGARGRHGPKLDASLRNIASVAHQRRNSQSQNIGPHDDDHNQQNRMLADSSRRADSYDSRQSEGILPAQTFQNNGYVGFVPGFNSYTRGERSSSSQSDSGRKDFSDLSSAHGGVRLGPIEESPSGSTRTLRSQTNPFANDGQYPFHRAETSSVNDSSEASQSSIHSAAQQDWTPSYSSGAPMPYVTAERMPLGGQQVTAPSMPPLYRGSQGFTPAQFQAWHQFQAAQGTQHLGVPMYGYPQQYGAFPTTHASSLPPGVQAYQGGMWLPDGREARAPARSRLAPQHVNDPRFNTDAALPPVPSMGDFPRRSPNSTPARFINRDRLLYLEGSDDMYPQPTAGGGPSMRYQSLIRHSPSGALAMQEENRPFTTKMREPAKWGVMKIGNIPYDLSKQSVLSFLGNHAKLITPDFGPSVHIIMERATGKTQDCYVEFFSVHDAQAWVKVINSRGNVNNRIGDRVLDVSLSNQDQLLKELFPRAKNVAWKDGQPTFEQSNDIYNTGFKTFLSAEELQVLVRHAEQPHRSTYTLKCQTRPFEAMISLLAKFPWQATANYTLATRNKIFEAAHKMLFILSNIIRRSSSSHGSTPSTSTMTSPVDQLYGPFSAVGTAGAAYGYPAAGAMMPARPTPAMPKPLNAALLQDLLRASLNAQGFSEAQRWQLYTTVADPMIRGGFRISPICAGWPFQAVRRKPRIEEDVVEFYAHLISHHPYVAAQVQVQPTSSSSSSSTTTTITGLPITTTTAKSKHPPPKFGEVGAMIARDIEDKMNMRDIGLLEEHAIEQILRDQFGES